MRSSLGFETIFDEQFYSYELGFAKPEAGYFQAIMDRINVAPHRVLFIDDHEGNVAGASELGIHSELFARDGGVPVADVDLGPLRRTAVTVRIGISGWTYPPWRGEFYPPGLPQRKS